MLDDLLYALMLPSGNDAAIVLAENCGCLLHYENIGEKTMLEEMHSVDITDDPLVSKYNRLFLKEMN